MSLLDELLEMEGVFRDEDGELHEIGDVTGSEQEMACMSEAELAQLEIFDKEVNRMRSDDKCPMEFCCFPECPHVCGYVPTNNLIAVAYSTTVSGKIQHITFEGTLEEMWDWAEKNGYTIHGWDIP